MSTRAAAVAALCAAVALPTTASAASGASVVAGPIKVKDYQMTVVGSDAAKDSLSVMFNRTAGKATQSHFYTFGQGVTIKANKSLSTASIKGSLGKYGKIDLKLRGVGAVRKGTAPKGCTGKAGTLRTGTLRGTFKLNADTSYFRTVSAKSMKAQLAKGGKLTCDGAGNGAGGDGTTGSTMLTSTQETSDGMLLLSVTKDATGAINQQAMRTDDATATAPASIMHLINAPGTGAAFAPAADLGSARGTGVSPFFSGAFEFASEEPMGSMAMGTLSGDLAAKFDSIGTQQLAAGSPDAMLMRR
jgi:hypothetical protein